MKTPTLSEFLDSKTMIPKLNQVQEFSMAILPYWVAAALTALVAVFYAKIFGWSEQFALQWAAANPEMTFVITPLLLLTSAELARLFAGYAAGSGIPQMIAAIELSGEGHPFLKKLLSIPIIVVKLVGSCTCVIGGGVSGREGPMLQVSASIFQWVQNHWPVPKTKLDPQSIILAGGAAGLASAFNTPLGGVIFAVEELAKVHLSHVRTAVFHSVIIAGLLVQAFLGNYLYFGKIAVEPGAFSSIWPLAGMSIVLGALGCIFSIGLVNCYDWRNRLSLPGKWVFTAFCGLAVASIFYFTNNSALGSGRHVILDLLTNTDHPAPLELTLARGFGNFFTYIGGAVGGVFAPALSTGAAFGSWMSQFVSGANPHLWILAGMISFLTGITRTPFTSLILVLEMTDSHGVILHLMIAGILAQASARVIDPVSFYEHMARRILHTARESSTSVSRS